MTDAWLEVVADGLDPLAAEDVAEKFTAVFGDDVVVEERPAGDVSVRAFLRDDDPRSARLAALERDLGGVRLRVGDLVNRNWGDAWREVHEPIEIGDRLVVQAPWLPPTPNADVTIRIDPGMAFGVGTHASTRLALEVLSTVATETPAALADGAVLDVGTGTGILSLAALGFGARHATLCDIDPHAAEAVRRNAALNDRVGALSYFRGSTNAISEPPAMRTRNATHDGFNLVIANIVAPVLLGLLDDFVAQMKPHATLVLSGIFEKREPEILDATASSDLRLIARKHADGFVALAFRQPK